MHSFEVHSNESACRKNVRLGLEQVIYGGYSSFLNEMLSFALLQFDHKMLILFTPMSFLVASSGSFN